jgi:hypothetical protein
MAKDKISEEGNRVGYTVRKMSHCPSYLLSTDSYDSLHKRSSRILCR